MLDGVQTKTCYCAIGAGGKPCVDRAYCDVHRDRKFAERVESLRKPDEYGNDGRCRFNCRTAKENWMQGYIEAQHNAARGVDLDAQEAWKDVRKR